MNQLLIGIEIESRDTERPNYLQYDSLADLIIWYSYRFNWRWPFVMIGHGSIALPPGRRSDPRMFDWGSLMGRLYVRSMQARVPGLMIGD